MHVQNTCDKTTVSITRFLCSQFKTPTQTISPSTHMISVVPKSTSLNTISTLKSLRNTCVHQDHASPPNKFNLFHPHNFSLKSLCHSLCSNSLFPLRCSLNPSVQPHTPSATLSIGLCTTSLSLSAALNMGKYVPLNF